MSGSQIDTKALDPLAEAITEHWGERCPDFDADCSCCKAWAELDRLATLSEQPAPDHAGLVERLTVVAAYVDDMEKRGPLSIFEDGARKLFREAIAALSRAPDLACSSPTDRTRIDKLRDLVEVHGSPEDEAFFGLLVKSALATPPPQQGDAPAADGWMCDGCRRLTKNPERDLQELRLIGAISCCPERKMLPVKVRPTSPAASQEGGGE